MRAKRRQERLKKIAEGRAVKRVRVVPRDENIRRDIRHGVTGVRFPKEGSVEWPFDQFTKRRLRDKTVSLESAEAQQERHSDRQRSRQQHAQRREPPPTPPAQQSS